MAGRQQVLENPAPEATEEPSVLDRVLALLQDQTRKIEELEQRLEQKAGSQFRPMEQPPGSKPAGGMWGKLEQEIGGKGRRGWGSRETSGVSGQVLIDIHGEKIPERMLEHMGPRFYDGDRVRINPESTREGFPEGTTWGDILARLAQNAGKKKPNPHGIGTVTKILWYTDDEGWKYKVEVPGVTGARPDGFHDRELLPA